jgi:hypothetical protein
MATLPTRSATTDATPEEAIVLPGSRSSVHTVYEDPFRLNKWTTQYPEQVGLPVEDAESAKHALVARYKLSASPSKTLDLHSVVVQSPLLKQSLARVLNGYPGITTDLERLEFNAPFECFVHRWDQLHAEKDEMIRQVPNGPEDGNTHAQAAAHLELLCSTLEGELGSVVREKKDMVAHGVMKFKNIWALFEPGCLVYQKSKFDGDDRVYKLKTAKPTTINSGQVYQLECQYIDFDGTAFGLNKETINITEYQGTKKITKFEAYPLEFREDSDNLKQRLIERGRLFEAYKGHHFVGYDGIAIGKVSRGEQKFNVKSRIIIDGHSFSRYSQKMALEHIGTPDIRADTANYHSGEETDDDCVVLDENIGHKQPPPPVGKKLAITVDSRFSLNAEQHLIASSKVRGYSLRDKKWFSFFICSITDITWNEDAFASLVAPKEQKDLILSFTESQVKNHEQFDDFVQGKGKGIIMLLAGPPGVGKTLTAESVAETLKSPLYSIGAADLGSKPNQVENKLQDLLEMCSKWNAGTTTALLER